MTAEFNTLGDPLVKPFLRPPKQITEPPPSKGYKAVVMVFLAGGADTFNLLVPQDCDVYQQYRTIRTDLLLEPRELIKFSTTGQACSNFGVHGSFGFLKSLYDKKQAAFIANVGNLAEPIRDKVHMRSVERCHGLFSHSDQQNGAQTLKCQDMGTAAKGTGGRIADALAEGPHKFVTTSWSLAGTSIWPQGVTTQREIVDGRLGSSGVTDYERWRGTIGNITATRHGNVYAEAYAEAFLDAITTTETVAQALQGVEPETNFPTNTGLARSLRQVSQLIKTRDGRKAERDLFYIAIGGWDMHSNMKASSARRFGEIDAALRAFVAEMGAQKVWDKVVLATESEFARTLDSNGGGSDHAWAGNHFVIGGSINGGRVLNKFHASLAIGNDHDLGRGRMIPDYPWESMMVPIAEWFGLEEDQKPTVFPNLHRFNASKHIIPDLFKAGAGDSSGPGGGGRSGGGSR